MICCCYLDCEVVYDSLQLQFNVFKSCAQGSGIRSCCLWITPASIFVGADGSVRMFDLRHLEHSTIIYEDPQHTPLLRLAWNKQDPNYLATVAMDACEVPYSLYSTYLYIHTVYTLRIGKI